MKIIKVAERAWLVFPEGCPPSGVRIPTISEPSPKPESEPEKTQLEKEWSELPPSLRIDP